MKEPPLYISRRSTVVGTFPLKGLIGFKTHFGLGMVDGNSVDPSKFEQDFDWRYSKIVKMMSEAEWNQQVDYRGPRDEE